MNVMLLAIALLSPAFGAQAQVVVNDANIVNAPSLVEEVAMVEPVPVFEEVEVAQESIPVVEIQKNSAMVANAKVEYLENELAQKQEVIEKLSLHLESALKRLNSCKGLEQTPSKMSAVLAAKDVANKKARALQTECDVLKKRLSAIEKEKQLLDLENRQLFHALNGVQPSGRVASKSVYSKKENRSQHVAAYPSY